MNRVYLALGSNLGDTKKNIQKALFQIEKEIGTIIATSTIHQTNPIGFVSDNLFANSVCCVLTSLSCLEVLSTTQNIEVKMGRREKSVNHKYKDRIIDIDILLYNDEIIETDNLTIPHPEMLNRSFVLDPLNEIAPDLYHPLIHRTISELKSQQK